MSAGAILRVLHIMLIGGLLLAIIGVAGAFAKDAIHDLAEALRDKDGEW